MRHKGKKRKSGECKAGWTKKRVKRKGVKSYMACVPMKGTKVGGRRKKGRRKKR